jgi:shikimate kinase
MNLALIGMPGCGKSTVGRHLARHLGLRFVDADTELESRIGMPIRAFFETHGEAAFRDEEQAVIEDLSHGQGLLIANREALHARCKVFYMRATPEELYRRLRHDTQRPLLQVADPLKRLRELYRERDPLYRRTAHFTVETPRPSVQGLQHMILMQLELAGLIDAGTVPSPVDPLAHPMS